MTDEEYRQKYGPWSIVIGASMGIGAACARRLASKGINVIVSARSQEKLEALAAEIEKQYGVKAMALPQDILTDNAYDNIQAATKDLELGSAVFSAAYCYNGPFLVGRDEQYRRMADLNIFGAYRFGRYFGERFCRQKRGGLLFLGSLAGYYGSPGQTFYGGTKAFEIALAEGLYSEFKPYNVDVTVDLIGAVRTPGLVALMGEKICDEMKAADENVVGNECIDSLGQGPTAVITKEMRQGVNMMRKFMSLNKQTITCGDANMKINMHGFADQFSKEDQGSARLGDKIGQ